MMKISKHDGVFHSISSLIPPMIRKFLTGSQEVIGFDGNPSILVNGPDYFMPLEFDRTSIERVISAAIQIGDHIFVGAIHALCLANAQEMLLMPDLDEGMIPNNNFGFLTSHARCVSRREAWEVASQAQQIDSAAGEHAMRSQEFNFSTVANSWLGNLFQKTARALSAADKSQWVTQEAKQFLEQITPLLNKSGYQGSIIGGVARIGWSNHDLDILLRPIQDDKFDFERLWLDLENALKANGDFTQEMGTFELHLPDGRLVDFCFEDAPQKGAATQTNT